MKALVVWCVLGRLAGCVSSSSVSCDDGSTCPAGTQCATTSGRTLCVTPDQRAACDGLPDQTSCSAMGAPMGACHDGTCVEIACGNYLVDPGEQCDMGDQEPGGGCSADCRSTEICGNGQVDGRLFEQCDDGNLENHDGCDSRCLREAATWSSLQIDKILARGQAAMAYDAAHGVTVLFGGTDPSEVTSFNDTWLWNGQGWMNANPPSRPSPRTEFAMAYDAARARIVLFGGNTANGPVSDTWEWDGATWTLRASAKTPPPRYAHVMAYDAARKRVVLFGGRTPLTNSALPDCWEWDGTAWEQVLGNLPTARGDAVMAFDPKRGKLVLYGGYGGTPGYPQSFLFDTWTFDGTVWQLVGGSTSAQPITTDSAMAWDPVSERLLLFGGHDDAFGTQNLTFAWDGSQWSQLTATPPAARVYHAMATDPIRRRVVVFGGELFATTSEWDGTGWNDVTPVSPLQPAHEIATDGLRGRSVMFDSAGETWEFDGIAWSRRTVSGPTARDGSTLVYDQARREAVMFGGVDNGIFYDETWRFNGTQWSLAAPATKPSGRHFAATTYDAARQRVVLFGGKGASPMSDTWLWDGSTWTQATPTTVPEARYHAALAYDPDHQQVVMFGGLDDSVTIGASGATWLWDGSDWRTAAPANHPSPRWGASLAWDPARRKIVLFGGASAAGVGNIYLQDTWEWDGTDWIHVPTNELPSNRADAPMFADPSGAGVDIYGGTNQLARQGDETWRLRWTGPTLDEACRDTSADFDGDGRPTCADTDCWARCTPVCPPGTSCMASEPRCGDGTCNAALETCRSCPQDCSACALTCGDGYCDPAESITTCPGDCTP